MYRMYRYTIIGTMEAEAEIWVRSSDRDQLKIKAAKRKMTMKDLFHELVNDGERCE